MQRNIDFISSGTLKYLQLVVLSSLILYFGRTIFIPLSFALLISFVLYPICTWLEKKGIGRLMAIGVAFSFLTICILLVVSLLVYQFVGFLNDWQSIHAKFMEAMEELSDIVSVLGFTREEQAKIVSRLANQSTDNIFSVIRNSIATYSLSIVMVVLIPVYTVLIIYHRGYWMKILQRIFPSEGKERLREIVVLTVKAYYNFIKGMAVVYLVVGSLNSVGLLLMGVPHAILFGFIASILTFIPYVGIIVGALLPISVAWITYNSIWYPIGIIGIFGFVQYLEANLIFPIAVSSRLNVNTLVMLISIFVGGMLWGMSGMILFVPFVGIAKLIADHNPKWKTASMILGIEQASQEKGEQ